MMCVCVCVCVCVYIGGECENCISAKGLFCKGLNHGILTELACKDDDLTLDQLITLSI